MFNIKKIYIVKGINTIKINTNPLRGFGKCIKWEKTNIMKPKV